MVRNRKSGLWAGVIGLLLALIAVPGGAAAEEKSEPIVQDEPGSLTERLAAWTQSVAEGLVDQVTQALIALDPRAQVVDWPAVGAAALDVGMVIVPTVLLFLLLRWAERPLFLRVAQWAGQEGGVAGLWWRGVAIGGAALSDVAVIVLSWVVGYALALFVLGESGTMDMRQSLFLNAFLGLELLKVGLRLLFAPRYYVLRLMPLDDAEAAYWYAWLARLVDFVGYGLLLIVPIVSADLSSALGAIVAFGVLVVGLVYAIAIIRQNRARVRARLEGIAAASSLAFSRFALALLARTWHVLAIVYVAALALAIQLRPETALPFIGQATVQSVIVLGLGIAGYVALSGVLGRPIRVPAATRERLPDLEARLNLFVPASVHLLRLLLGLVVLFGLLDAWRLFNAPAWIVSEVGTRTLAAALSVAIIIATACTVWVMLASWIDARLNLDGESGEDIGARKRTLLALFRNALAIVLATLTLMVVLSEIGINIAPLLAGAGVLGLAVGFGAQKLVQDIITGVFIQLENAVNTGDFITVGGLSGTVERLSIRSVGIRDLEGTFHIIPFSYVDTVSNYMRGHGYHLGVYRMAYRENTDDAFEQLRAAYAALMEDPDVAPHVLGELEVDGVTQLADSSVNIRARIRTEAGMQWYVGRAYNRLVKRYFDAAGIEIPVPHTMLYFGQNREGTAAPLRVRMLADEESSEAGADVVRAAAQGEPAAFREESHKQASELGEEASGEDEPGATDTSGRGARASQRRGDDPD